MFTIQPIAFKAINLTVGTLAICASIAQFIQVYSNYTAFLFSMYGFLLSIPIIYLEYQIPFYLYRYSSFYFSFLGRGVLYILLSGIISFGSILNHVASIVAFLSGLFCIGLHFIPDINEPDNFKIPSLGITIEDDNAVEANDNFEQEL
ncbi:hypothetical protein Kpol_1061p52 [Vanderwaltozyma polyspora DSM 70294]|uniref:Golgi apparatus membrane protein TVP15 n=1 Tax=Vanderwaltozyma polyspora (strain ATCC 22028 / DSM 70294 / BCRC 21397 / CBS 2163 / NBRC 10782 / NRRL Y-8283 / UCD 57-17) TaxID=436907 RepID=A7TJH6_VANPO|nr:uncharacterized protein Kpol_1061p52 [Vanderwaltozyma polyspora DSM 70294]EDO17626.1 hypothetical protein Kpol_1061p52 [Vanderwaltozyma polyspora DSM 70294]